MLGNASVDQLLSAAGRQLSREKENWSVVSLLLRRVFISSARVWSSLRAEGHKRRGPCAGSRCRAQLRRESHCLDSDCSALRSFSPPPTALEFSQLLLKSEALGRHISKQGLDFQGQVPTQPAQQSTERASIRAAS